jgi:hypothetical protein
MSELPCALNYPQNNSNSHVAAYSRTPLLLSSEFLSPYIKYASKIIQSLRELHANYDSNRYVATDSRTPLLL